MKVVSDRGDPPAGEQIVVVFLEASSSVAVAVVSDALRKRGFDVYPASSGNEGPRLEFEYEQARYLVTALNGNPTPGPAIVAALAPKDRIAAIKVLLFPGAPTSRDRPEVFQLEWDRAGRWLDDLVGAVRTLHP